MEGGVAVGREDCACGFEEGGACDPAAADMRAAGPTQGCERVVERGWRPSEGVIPPALREASAA